MRRPPLRTCAAVLLVLSAAACVDQTSFTQPEVAAARVNATPASVPGFTFLAPIERTALPTGELNESLPLTVDVCPATGECTDATRVARFTTEGSGARAVRVSDDGSGWVVNWKTSDTPSAATGTYRVDVRVGTVLLGSSEVRVVSGQTLPIRFWIPVGSLDAAVIGEEGGAIEASSGELVLSFPSGALSANTVITVEPLVEESVLPPGVLPGTAFEFGPDGTTFEEPVFIGIQVDPATVPPGVLPEQLRVHRLENGQWVPLPFSDFDPESNTVGTWTEHFSTYAVLPAEFTQLAVGDRHACAGTGDAVYCWGDNAVGQLGIGSAEVRSALAVAVDLPRFPVGELQRCRRTGGPSGTVTCVSETVTQPLAIESIDAGLRHTCVSGLVPGSAATRASFCWGGNQSGQLGNGSTTASAVPTESFVGRQVAEVTAGNAHTCIRETSGDVWCVGATSRINPTTGVLTSFGDLGDGPDNPCAPLAYCVDPRRVNLPAAAVRVRAGLRTTCADLESGANYCWGWNNAGQVGDGTFSAAARVPTQVIGSPYASVTPGSSHTCARTASGQVICWGNGVTGALGRGTFTTAVPPLPPIAGITFALIEPGKADNAFRHTCGIDSLGDLFCWGANESGQLGVAAAGSICTVGTTNLSCTATPTPIATSVRFSVVRLGSSFTCALSRDGKVFCWGRNADGNLGDGTTTSRFAPARVLTTAIAP